MITEPTCQPDAIHVARIVARAHGLAELEDEIREVGALGAHLESAEQLLVDYSVALRVAVHEEDVARARSSLKPAVKILDVLVQMLSPTTPEAGPR